MRDTAEVVLTRARNEEARAHLRGPGEARRDASPATPAEEALIRRLAIDRLRELRDEGASFPYIARMYESDPDQLRELFTRLNYGPRSISQTRR